ncbi:MAG: tyrosine--tRNA ligase, partial [Deltaproteobacteria bacterium]|nr:tyrosine--tRNA ligase [Deltaproteobacteria bacterium]
FVVARPELEAGIDLVDLLVRASLSSSRGEAKRLLQSGGVYVNNVRADLGARVSSAHLASPSFLVLRAGKKRQCLVRVA